MQIETPTYAAYMRGDFHLFLQRVFAALNPQTNYLDNWHLRLIASKLEACRLGRCRR